MERKFVLMAVLVSVFGALIAIQLPTPATAETTGPSIAMNFEDVVHNPITFPGTGIRIYTYLGPPIQYATTLDYFYVRHGWLETEWSLQNETYRSWFLSPANYYTLETNATNFQHPPLQEWVGYDIAADVFWKLFWFQFQPGDLAPGAYSFTGTHYFNYTVFIQRTITLIITPPPIVATIDIDPDTLNLKSNGEFVTAYIELPEGYDVADIVLKTVYLEGIQAITDPTYGFVTDPDSYLTDHDGDGILERMVKFDRVTVRDTLTDVIDYDEGTKLYDLTLTVAGELLDGTLFEGTDTVAVIKK